MSLTLESIFVPQKPLVTLSSPHVYESEVVPMLTIVKSDVRAVFAVHIKAGFKCDGASIPWPFRWFLPSWDEDDAEDPHVTTADIYNLGSTIHDGFYIHKGFGLFSREECDDILRGIWRQSGISRIKAGIADKCVEWFAGGKEHWGNDSYGVSNNFRIEW